MTKKKKAKFFTENYRKSWKYIKESRKFIYTIIIIFLLFIFIGAFIPAPELLEEKILEYIQELLRMTEGMSGGKLISFIFLNNLQSSFFGMMFGIVLGIFSMITSVLNGYLLGFVSSKVVYEEGIFVLWRLFPHGIFELPALFLSTGLGLRLGTFIFKKNKLESLKNYLFGSLRVFILVVLPLLIIAAIIEGILISFF